MPMIWARRCHTLTFVSIWAETVHLCSRQRMLMPQTRGRRQARPRHALRHARVTPRALRVTKSDRFMTTATHTPLAECAAAERNSWKLNDSFMSSLAYRCLRRHPLWSEAAGPAHESWAGFHAASAEGRRCSDSQRKQQRTASRHRVTQNRSRSHKRERKSPVLCDSRPRAQP